MDRNELPLGPRHLGVPLGASKRISELVVHLLPTKHLSCTDTNSLQTDRNEIPYDPSHLGVPSGASKTISEPMVCSAPTAHLSCTDTNSLQMDRNEIPQDPHHLEVPRVRRKRFPSLWYVRRKPCTYLASRLAISINRSK